MTRVKSSDGRVHVPRQEGRVAPVSHALEDLLPRVIWVPLRGEYQYRRRLPYSCAFAILPVRCYLHPVQFLELRPFPEGHQFRPPLKVATELRGLQIIPVDHHEVKLPPVVFREFARYVPGKLAVRRVVFDNRAIGLDHCRTVPEPAFWHDHSRTIGYIRCQYQHGHRENLHHCLTPILGHGGGLPSLM